MTPFQEQFWELSNERDQWLRRVLASWREGYLAGWRMGCMDVHRPRELQDFDPPGEWPMAVLGPLPPVDPVLDCVRYPPNGRKRFGEKREGEYQGGPVTW